MKDTFGLSPEARGVLEIPRELPGFLVVAMAGVLCMLSVARLGVVGGAMYAIGLAGLAFLGTTYSPMLAVLIVASAGMHLLQPVGESIAIGLSHHGNRGLRMGQMGLVGNAGMILGSGMVWLFLSKTHTQYNWAFLGAAVLAAMGALTYSMMHLPELGRRRPRLTFRRKFWLYYLLEILFGARKQIFITFGPWVLIEVYKEPANQIAQLFMFAAILGVVFRPLAGQAIDWFGERAVLVCDGLALALVCLGYGYARAVFSDSAALWVACTCFVMDSLLFALGRGRSIYMSRIADSPEEITATLAMGVSINHIASMFIPAIAGTVWVLFGYEKVFLAATILAFLVSAASSLVPRKREMEAARA